MEQITEIESLADDVVSPAAIQQDNCPQETDMSCSYTAQDPTKNELLDDETSILYLQDQLSELLKEFPYGIEPVNMHEGCAVQQMADPISKPQTCEHTGCDSKDSTDQIQITILNSEQMKELFPEQDGPPNEVDRLTELQEEKPVTKKGTSVTHRHVPLKKVVSLSYWIRKKMMSVAVPWGGSLWFMKEYLSASVIPLRTQLQRKKKGKIRVLWRPTPTVINEARGPLMEMTLSHLRILQIIRNFL